MNGKERVEAVMGGTQPDRVPVMCQLSLGHVVKNSGMSPAEFLINYNRAYSDTLVKLTLEYGLDGVLLDYPGHPYSEGINTEKAIRQVEKITKEGDGELITWKNGDSIYCPPNDYPFAKTGIAAAKKDITDLHFTDLTFNVGYHKNYEALPEHFLESYRMIIDNIGNTHSVHGFVAAPLSGLMANYGIEDTLFGLLDYPEVCINLLYEVTEACILWVDALAKVGVHAICVSAPYEGSGLISLDLFNTFGLPFIRRLTDHIRARGVYSYMHMCGSMNDRLEAVADSGIDGIECLDPAPIGNVDLEDAVRRIGGRVFIKGNIDPVNTLLIRSKEEVYMDAVRRIKTGKPTERYILSTACSVSPNTPAENIKILANAAEDYGWY